MNFEGVNDPAIQEKLKRAKTPDEILAIAKEEGYEVSEEELEAINGGWDARCTEYRTTSGPF